MLQRYVLTDRQVVNIFTQARGTNKLQHFSEMLGIQQLDVLHLNGRVAPKNDHCDDEPEQEPTKGKRRAKEET